MEAVIIAAELRLTPQGGSKLVNAAPANNDAKHVVLNARAYQDVLVVLRAAILDLQVW